MKAILRDLRQRLTDHRAVQRERWQRGVVGSGVAAPAQLGLQLGGRHVAKEMGMSMLRSVALPFSNLLPEKWQASLYPLGSLD